MEKTINFTPTKIIRGLALSNLVILGLSACSSSPSPWTQDDESPWNAKHAEEQIMLDDDEMIEMDTSLSDLEPMVMLEPEMAAEPEIMVPVMVQEELTIEQEIMASSGAGYAVQVYAGNSVYSVEKFQSSRNLSELKMVKTSRSGNIVYVLIDMYADRSTANAAAIDLETRIGSKPWVRSIAGLQKIVAQ